MPLLTCFFLGVGLALGWGVRRFHNEDLHVFQPNRNLVKSQNTLLIVSVPKRTRLETSHPELSEAATLLVLTLPLGCRAIELIKPPHRGGVIFPVVYGSYFRINHISTLKLLITSSLNIPRNFPGSLAFSRRYFNHFTWAKSYTGKPRRFLVQT